MSKAQGNMSDSLQLKEIKERDRKQVGERGWAFEAERWRETQCERKNIINKTFGHSVRGQLLSNPFLSSHLDPGSAFLRSK